MKDLSDRFAKNEGENRPAARPDALARLHQPSPDDGAPEAPSVRRWFGTLSGRSDLAAALCAALAAALVLWPLAHPPALALPAIAESGGEVATLTVQPLSENGVATAPDWYGLFNAYQLETSLRDISIRCNYGLPVDARVDRYLHARLPAGTAIQVFLADPGKCPKL
ncbi:MAG TPA: hypothetical protein VNU97_03530 [Rhizomicrobium sp.]|jgi:hypothetical protein|nr:hypothetical protein [Rhizomicrobium sp.]